MTQIVTSPLSPVQQGMLFHTLYAPHNGNDIQQIIAVLHEPVHHQHFRTAWHQLGQEQPMLRTAFRWQDSATPHQFVVDHIELPFSFYDWQSLAPHQQQTQFESYKQADRYQGFDLNIPPLFRVALFQFGPNHYQFIWSFHHAILDGFSFTSLIKQLFTIYAALQNTQSVSPLNNDSSYTDYAQWIAQQNWSTSYPFWRQYLANVSAPTPLTINQPATTKTPQFLRQTTTLGLPLSSQLRQFSQNHPFNLNTLIQAAWALLLARYAQKTAALFGVTKSIRASSGQHKKQFASTIGIFLNTLPLYLDINPSQTIIDWLTYVRHQWLALRPHEQTPLVEIHRQTAVPTDDTLFHSILIFNYQTMNTDLRQQGPDWQNRYFDVERQTGYPLSLFVYAETDILLQLEYNSDLFTHDAIQRLLQHFHQILTYITHNPHHFVADVNLLPPSEAQHLLHAYNQTNINWPQPKATFLTYFHQQVANNPQRPALTYANHTLTYAELNHHANHLAATLQQQGITHGHRLAIYLHRSPQMLIALLATLKIGATYVPLDPHFPADRITYMLADAQVKLILTEKTLVGATSFNTPTLTLPLTPTTNTCPNPPEPPPTTPAYLIYTSGSTGQPKGVVIPHHTLLNFLLSMQQETSFTAHDTILAITTISFDIATLELYLPLITGAHIILADQETITDGFKLAQLLQEKSVSVMQATPSSWRLLLAADWDGDPNLTILCGGEALPADLAQQLVTRAKTVWNVYGPTETTVWSAINKITPATRPITIGHPLANTQLYILDNALRPLPTYVPGELYIGGDGLASGYHQRPALTAERFIPNPFSSQPGGRLYRTGDLARHHPQHGIEILGRLDHQVKIRGHRIELGEIEAQLVNHPHVETAVVIPLPLTDNTPQLVAYFLPTETTPTHQDLHQFLAQTLPDYMLPTLYIPLDTIPLTPNGKINRRALPSPQQQTTPLTDPPQTDQEKALAAIWQTILNVDQVNRHDNFFELGGHSLLATQLIFRIRQQLDYQLPVRALFEHPTLAQLAQQLNGSAPPLPPAIPPLPYNPQARYPLTPAQKRLWFLNELYPLTSVYNVALALHITGPLDAAHLQTCLNQLIARHNSLRAAFVTIDNNTVQKIASSLSLPLPIIDLQHTHSDRVEAATQHYMQDCAHTHFDLTTPPLLQATLIKRADDHILMLVIHHMIVDGWSLNIIVRELTALYHKHPLPPQPIQFTDYAHWLQNNQATSPETETFWQQHLAAPREQLNLPLDAPRPPMPSFVGEHLPFSFPPELNRHLQNLAQTCHTTPFVIFLASFYALWHYYTNQTDIIIGTPTANRPQAELSSIVGYFVNTIPLRAHITGALTFDHIVAQLKETTTNAFRHETLPFEKIIEQLQIDRDLSYQPLFQVLLALNEQKMTPHQEDAFDWQPRIVPTKTAKFDLVFHLGTSAAGAAGRVEFNTDIFTPTTVQRLIDHWILLTKQLSHNRTTPLSQLTRLTATDHHQLFNIWNQTDHPYPLEPLLPTLISRQATQTPNAIAVQTASQQLTYQQLEDQTNQLAHYLQDHGVKPHDFVAVGLARGIPMVIASLAIMKLGAAYLPLDVTHPPDRLTFMLADAAPQMVLIDHILADRLGPHLNITPLDNLPDLIAPYPTTPPTITLQPNFIAYIIYTSGSTGKPKGTLVPHRGLLNLIYWHNQAFQITPADHATQLARPAFDASVWEIWPYLTIGATIHFPPEELLIDPPQLRDWLINNQITVSFLPTPLAQTMLSLQWPNHTALRYLLTGGDKLRQNPPESLPFQVVNNYGPTENSVVTTSHTISSTTKSQPAIPSIGRPISNNKLYILNSYLQPVPIGVAGELYISSPGLAYGYHQRPIRTAQQFIPNPFAAEPGERLYRTGDIVRYLADGSLEFIGRGDHQIKIRGFRIELGEIESKLRDHPHIDQCLVIAKLDNDQNQQLIAYVIPNDPTTNTTPFDLHQFLQATLPSYMLPTAYIPLTAWPKTPNDKIDQHALPTPERHHQVVNNNYTSPRNAAEEVVANIWQQLLGHDQISIFDNFFTLGGHSLLATQLITRISKAFRLHIPLQTLFTNPTIADLTAAMTALEPHPGHVQKIAQLRQKIANMSPAELAKLRASKQ
ncbi:MAG TPA: amino acid adenylation domain-containing protein [Anaerolineae bacterium]|nr:amino acid adenylation domain-containing protein [Anaerolineae bacterium]